MLCCDGNWGQAQNLDWASGNGNLGDDLSAPIVYKNKIKTHEKGTQQSQQEFAGLTYAKPPSLGPKRRKYYGYLSWGCDLDDFPFPFPFPAAYQHSISQKIFQTPFQILESRRTLHPPATFLDSQNTLPDITLVKNILDNERKKTSNHNIKNYCI
ncbi:hypothetical protein BDZ91DRAFT_768868 [Kalaharituber pfeilii]|nr:hypothetical protein BDZ91DRAFT_768868 [Kalaharituber pfeilii]